MAKIAQKGNRVLRERAKEITPKDILSAKIKKLVTDMKKTLANEPDGVGLAAPQVGEPLRMFVVSGKVLKEKEEKQPEDLVFINPTVVKKSRKKELMDEGCLSVRGKYDKVKRAVQVTIRGYDENGKRVERGASGLLAQIFQHEIDHLDGILFIDKVEHGKKDAP